MSDRVKRRKPIRIHSFLCKYIDQYVNWPYNPEDESLASQEYDRVVETITITTITVDFGSILY